MIQPWTYLNIAKHYCIRKFYHLLRLTTLLKYKYYMGHVATCLILRKHWVLYKEGRVKQVQRVYVGWCYMCSPELILLTDTVCSMCFMMHSREMLSMLRNTIQHQEFIKFIIQQILNIRSIGAIWFKSHKQQIQLSYGMIILCLTT